MATNSVSMDVDISSALKSLQLMERDVFHQGISRGLGAAADVVKRKAQRNRSYKSRTGTHRRAYDVEAKYKPYPTARLLNLTPQAFYLEMGTKRGIKERRIIRSAAEQTVPKQIEAMGKEIDKSIAEIGNRTRKGVK